MENDVQIFHEREKKKGTKERRQEREREKGIGGIVRKADRLAHCVCWSRTDTKERGQKKEDRRKD